MVNCTHPESEREPYHDCTIKCRACNCVIEQFGRPLKKPAPLGPVLPSSSSPACSTAKRQTPYFERRPGENIALVTESLDEFGEWQVTRSLLSERSAARLAEELNGLL